MYDTLIVEIDQPFEDLRNIHSYEILWELSKLFDNVMEGTILTEPNNIQSA
jgi:hypothetical protein